MPAAVVAAGIGAAGAVGGAVISSNASKSAAKANQQAADQASALQRETRDINMQALAPWQQSGLAANNQINALLGLGVPQGGSPGSVNWAGYVQGNPDALANWNAIQGTPAAQQFGGDLAKFGQYHYGADGSRRDLTPYTAGQMGGTTTDAARAAFDQFRNSTGYQFRLGQGMDAVNSGYAGRGMIKSGDAMKAINDYGQGMASAEFGNYMGLLQGQAGTGLSAANAQAGVATNAANNMGNIALQNGSNQANAALLRAQSTGQLVNSLATIGGGLAGQLGGRSSTSTAPNYGSALASVGSQLQGPYVPLPRI